jgi:flagellar hook-associated protein 2
MPVTLGGMSSGIDTEGIIKKLLDIEARPIQQWEEDKLRYSKRKEALYGLRTRIIELNNSAKDLYGFRSTYQDKKAVVSESSVIEAVANKHAGVGQKNIEVLELASTHKIITDPIEEGVVLPSGKFKIEVNGEAQTIRFRGGNLRSLGDKIDEVAKDLVQATYINTSGKNYILTIESKVPGKKGEIKITGDQDFLKKIGLVKGEKGGGKEEVALKFDEKFFTSYIGKEKLPQQDGNIRVEDKGKSIRVKGLLWREYILPLEVVAKENTLLEFNFLYSEREAEEERALPFSMRIGPEERVVIKGIELKGYNISRVRPLKKKEEKRVVDIAGIGIVSKDNDKRYERIYRLEKQEKVGKQEIPIGRDFNGKKISKVIFYCNEGVARFSEARISTPIKGEGLLEPKNEITKASDAKMKVDGVEIVRDRNDNLNDVIKGVTLSLKGRSTKPVSIKVEPAVENSVDKIRKFVENYNKYLDFTKQLTKVEKSSKIGEYKKNRERNGLFIGDLTILRLENTLRSTIGSAYPSRSENPIKMITQLGISTGAINAEWETIKEGKLIIDDVRLNKTIVNNPEGVSEFFGSDNDGDNRVDNGLAFRINYVLKPFIVSGSNLIQSKIDLENNSIRMADERIDRRRDHLKKYEAKLRSKFAAMEKAVSGAKNQSKWLQMQMKNLQDNEDKK